MADKYANFPELERGERRRAYGVRSCPRMATLPVAISARREKIEREQEILLLSVSVHVLRLLGPIRHWHCDPRTRSLRPHETGSGSAGAQLLLKELAGIVAQNPRTDHAL